MKDDQGNVLVTAVVCAIELPALLVLYATGHWPSRTSLVAGGTFFLKGGILGSSDARGSVAPQESTVGREDACYFHVLCQGTGNLDCMSI